MMERGSSYEEKYLTERETSAELLADTLSDVPDDADSDSENDSDSSIIGNRQNKIVHPLPSYSDSEQSSNESDDETLDSAVSTWTKTDKTPNLGPFTGKPGVKQIPSNPTKVSQVTGLFLGETFFDMLFEETNRYYLQNQEKYVTGSKGLKWSDVTVAEMKKKFSIKKKLNSVHLQVLLSATPQGGMFPEVSHPQALLGSLMSISWKFQFTKLVSEFVINF